MATPNSLLAGFPRTLTLNFIKKQDMRYGENSHQLAAFYTDPWMHEASVATGDTMLAAYDHAYQTDLTSTFGRIIAFNLPLNAEAANYSDREPPICGDYYRPSRRR